MTVQGFIFAFTAAALLTSMLFLQFPLKKHRHRWKRLGIRKLLSGAGA